MMSINDKAAFIAMLIVFPIITFIILSPCFLSKDKVTEYEMEVVSIIGVSKSSKTVYLFVKDNNCAKRRKYDLQHRGVVLDNRSYIKFTDKYVKGTSEKYEELHLTKEMMKEIKISHPIKQ